MGSALGLPILLHLTRLSRSPTYLARLASSSCFNPSLFSVGFLQKGSSIVCNVKTHKHAPDDKFSQRNISRILRRRSMTPLLPRSDVHISSFQSFSQGRCSRKHSAVTEKTDKSSHAMARRQGLLVFIGSLRVSEIRSRGWLVS